MKAEGESLKDVKRRSNRVLLLLILGWFGIISGLGMFSPRISLIIGLILIAHRETVPIARLCVTLRIQHIVHARNREGHYGLRIGHGWNLPPQTRGRPAAQPYKN